MTTSKMHVQEGTKRQSSKMLCRFLSNHNAAVEYNNTPIYSNALQDSRTSIRNRPAATWSYNALQDWERAFQTDHLQLEDIFHTGRTSISNRPPATWRHFHTGVPHIIINFSSN